jgi:seryl-tRNA synthetase
MLMMQTNPEGCNVPEVLRKYIPGQPEFLPFVRELPKDTTSSKVKAKAGDAKAPKEAKKTVDTGAGVAALKDLKLDGK